MSNVNRERWGDPMVIPMPIETAVVVEIGDNVALVSGYIVPLDDVADAGDAAANREAGADAFVGIAKSASIAGETDDILVQTKGVIMLTQETAAAITIGDAIEPYADATSCDPQTVVAGSTSQIATCVKTHADTTAETLALLLPSKIFGTLQS